MRPLTYLGKLTAASALAYLTLALFHSASLLPAMFMGLVVLLVTKDRWPDYRQEQKCHLCPYCFTIMQARERYVCPQCFEDLYIETEAGFRLITICASCHTSKNDMVEAPNGLFVCRECLRPAVREMREMGYREPECSIYAIERFAREQVKENRASIQKAR